jgi:2-polyprenyl-6-methoxyphenol hydroxylase-like FAD-dependent oxidoreductase
MGSISSPCRGSRAFHAKVKKGNAPTGLVGMPVQVLNRHAVIVGGGIGGLLAAHALADRLERVTLVERDRYPRALHSSVAPARRGAPQGRCPHLLLTAGIAAFDELVPGWSGELERFGVRRFDASADAVVRLSNGELPRAPSSIAAFACSRSLLEKALRCDLDAKATVQVREGHKVVRLLGSRRGDRVTGVVVAETGTANETSLPSDLVVDASGAGSSLPEWISMLPNRRDVQIQKTVVTPDRQYVSRWFHIAPESAPDWRCLAIAPLPGTPARSAMMLRVEEDRWGVVLLGPVGERLPSDGRTFLDFVDSLGHRELRRTLAHARPISAIYRYGAIANRVMHYDRLAVWPACLAAFGDTVCMLDPYFGLGMTTAARGAVLLRTCLEQSRGELSGGQFQQQLALLNVEPWRLATGCEPDGRPFPAGRARLWRFCEAAPRHAEIAHALLGVQHLWRPAEKLAEIVL